jgi:hypothetical protein
LKLPAVRGRCNAAPLRLYSGSTPKASKSHPEE